MTKKLPTIQAHRQFFYAQITLSLLTILAPTASYGLFARQAPKALRAARPAAPSTGQTLWRIGMQQHMFASQEPKQQAGRSALSFATKASICIGSAAALAYYEYNKKMEQLTKKIFRATETGDIYQVRRLLPFFNVNQPNEYGQKLLHLAVVRDDLHMVKFLVNHGADVNASNDYGQTPIQLAVRFCHLYILEYLYLEAKATVETRYNNYMTLKIALTASRFGSSNRELIKFLVQVCNIDINCEDDDGTTILHRTVLIHKLDLLEFFVHRLNANVNAQDNLGNTPLHNLCYEWEYSSWEWEWDRTLMLSALIVKCGADIEIKNNKGLTPLEVLRHKLERKPQRITYFEDLFGKLLKERSEYVKQPHEAESHEQIRSILDRSEMQSDDTSILGGIPL